MVAKAWVPGDGFEATAAGDGVWVTGRSRKRKGPKITWALMRPAFFAIVLGDGTVVAAVRRAKGESEMWNWQTQLRGPESGPRESHGQESTLDAAKKSALLALADDALAVW